LQFKKIKNLRDYNKFRQKALQDNAESTGTSIFNTSNLLRKVSMYSLAESIALVDDDPDAEVDIDDLDIDDPSAFIYAMDEGCIGNIEISMMWDEKIVMMIRYLQFYGFFLLLFYETWPERWCTAIGPYLFAISGQWGMIGDFE
jgi:hypothetical protein